MENLLNFEDYDRLDENNSNQNMTWKELEHMDSISYLTTGIKDVIIWIGKNPRYKEKVIKISNIPNNKKCENCFALILPDFKIIGKVDKSFITDDVLNKIKKFFIKNMTNINKFYNGDLETFDLIDLIENKDDEK